MKGASAIDQPQYLALLHVLRTSEGLWAASRPFFERWDISPAQFNLLNLVADQPEGLSQAALSRQLLTHRSNVTGLVDRLERKTWVVRQASATDRRLWQVQITSGGRALVDEIRPLYLNSALQLMEGVSPAEAESMIRLLSQIDKNCQRLEPNLVSPSR